MGGDRADGTDERDRADGAGGAPDGDRAGEPAAREYTPRELMVAAAAREIEDGDVAFVGMRLPMLAFQLAVSTHAPGAVALYESGVVRADPADGFVQTMCDLANQRGAVSTTDMHSVMGRLERGDVDVGFLGTAEIDRHGNLNTTRVRSDATAGGEGSGRGDGNGRDGEGGGFVRLPGSGGACDIACLAGRTAILMPHEPRRFVESVEYVTSPGYPADGSGGEGRPAPGGGPEVLVTSRATFGFDGAGELYLRTVHPGVDVDGIREDVPWDLRTRADVSGEAVGTTDPPTEAELALIREFDPDGFWTRG